MFLFLCFNTFYESINIKRLVYKSHAFFSQNQNIIGKYCLFRNLITKFACLSREQSILMA